MKEVSLTLKKNFPRFYSRAVFRIINFGLHAFNLGLELCILYLSFAVVTLSNFDI